MAVLQWVLGLVILMESAKFVFSPSAAASFARTGMPNFIRLGLGWTEMVAALVFLIPRLLILGGWLLIGVLALAIVVHVLHGWYDVGWLIVDAAAAWAVMVAKKHNDGSGIES